MTIDIFTKIYGPDLKFGTYVIHRGLIFGENFVLVGEITFGEAFISYFTIVGNLSPT